MPGVSVNGVHIAYETQGTGEPVVLVHGFCGARSIWRLQAPELARSHRVIAVDLRGHGDSDKPQGAAQYSIGICADDLAGLLERLGIPSAVFMGQSMGTLVCQQLALAYPQRVKALILAGALAGSPPAGTIVGPWVERIVEEIEARGLGEYLKTIVPFWFSPGFDQTVISSSTRDSFKAAQHAAIAFCREVSGFSIRDRLSAIKVPTLIVVGEKDGRTPVEEAEYINRRIPDAWLKIIKRAGHMANVEKPEEFNRAVETFLRAALRA
jgi:pimeloyl-ACP methyl ester carboxylesterase